MDDGVISWRSLSLLDHICYDNSIPQPDTVEILMWLIAIIIQKSITDPLGTLPVLANQWKTNAARIYFFVSGIWNLLIPVHVVSSVWQCLLVWVAGKGSLAVKFLRSSIVFILMSLYHTYIMLSFTINKCTSNSIKEHQIHRPIQKNWKPLNYQLAANLYLWGIIKQCYLECNNLQKRS